MFRISKNAKLVLPGLAAGEGGVDRSQEYPDLARDFRQKLSSECNDFPFVYMGGIYENVEMAKYGQKMSLINPGVVKRYEVGGGMTVKAARLSTNRRNFKLTQEQLKLWDKGMKRETLKSATKAQLEQNDELRDILAATGKATLMKRIERRGPKYDVHLDWLEEIREEI